MTKQIVCDACDKMHLTAETYGRVTVQYGNIATEGHYCLNNNKCIRTAGEKTNNEALEIMFPKPT